ncbi:MAG: saccharopine dehydrogenase NADP-binding domain-containing protein [Bacteroidota bacterium]
MADFILYGAYGYTGRLITKYCKEYGLTPLLSGRNNDKLAALANEFGFPYQAVSLSDTEALKDLLHDAHVVMHAAGPFIHTAKAMLDVCLSTGTHYLDITGEIAVFSRAAKRDLAAHQANIMLMPGTGFDVVPTDCMAAYLKGKLPDATHLKLAFAWKGGGISHGTAKTMLLGLGRPGAIRKEGKIIPVPPAYKTEIFPFTGEKGMQAVTIPWGDIFTAYHTTGIPNIETYFAAPLRQQKTMKWSRYLGPILRTSFVQNYLRKKIEARPAGPSDDRREKARAYVYGEVSNAKGEKRAARLDTIEGYTLTARTALMITKRVIEGDWKKGYHTPAGLYGADLVMELADTRREDI